MSLNKIWVDWLSNIFNQTNAQTWRQANHYLVPKWEENQIIAVLLDKGFRQLESNWLTQQEINSTYYDMWHPFMLLAGTKLRFRKYGDWGAAVECKISQREKQWTGPRWYVKKERIVVAKPWAIQLADSQWIPLKQEDILRPLSPALTTQYQRMTFVSPEHYGDMTKVTIDIGLQIKNNQNNECFHLENGAVIEVKSKNGDTIIDKVLHGMWHSSENQFSKTNFWLALTSPWIVDTVIEDYSNKVASKFLK